MAQVVRTVNYLIDSAFHLIGEYADGENLDGTAFQRGLDTLNDIINGFDGTASYISTTKEVIFNLVPNQRDYIFSNVTGIIPDVVSNRISDIMYCNIVIDNFIWPVKVITRTQIFENAFNLSVASIPRLVLLKISEEYSTLSFYALPDKVYECRLQAKFYLDQFQKNQPIRNVPIFIQDYLKYELGRRLISFYPSSNWPQMTEDKYQELKRNLMNTNDIDMSVRQSNLLRWRTYYGVRGFGAFGGF